MKKVRITVVDGLPGCGKSTLMLDEMAKCVGRYILAAPRTTLVSEHADALRAQGRHLGTSPEIVVIHSEDGAPGQVRRRIAEACRQAANTRHVIVAITHEGLQSVDPATFSGWHVRIDETPDALASGELVVPVGWRWLETLYDLVPLDGTDWSWVKAKEDGPGLAYFMRDDFARHDLSAFHKRVLSPARVLVDVQDWAECSDSRRPIQWWSLWSPLDLADCRTVKIAASGYFSSLCHVASERFYSGRIEYETESVEKPRRAQPEVRIHYYTRSHRGSTSFWADGDGKVCLEQVGRHLGCGPITLARVGAV